MCMHFTMYHCLLAVDAMGQHQHLICHLSDLFHLKLWACACGTGFSYISPNESQRTRQRTIIILESLLVPEHNNYGVCEKLAGESKK